MIRLILLLCLFVFSPSLPAQTEESPDSEPVQQEKELIPNAAEILKQRHFKFTRDDLIYDINGYKVPTLDAFMGWVLLNNAENELEIIAQYFKDRGIEGKMPLYLALLQGTDWYLKGTSIFAYPPKKNWDKMVRTLQFIEKELIPVTGNLVPVSGERTTYYNQRSGGAGRSKHLQFCALDLTPATKMTRKELHKLLLKVHNSVGKKYNVGLGLYSGVRFHIDTCGFRRW